MIPRIVRDILTMRRNLKSDHPVPLSVSVNITARCNLRCEFCEKGTERSLGEVGLAEMKQLIDFAVRFDCPIFLGGGEPFMHSRIWDILEYARSVGKKVSMVTNGTLLGDLPAEGYELLGEALSVMTVSMDSADPGEHDRIRGASGTFDKAVAFVRSPLRRNRVAIGCVLMGDLAGADGMLELAAELRCPLNYQPIMFESNYPHLARLAWKEGISRQLAGGSDRPAALRALHRRARKLGVPTNLGLIRKFFDLYCRLAGTEEYFQDSLLNRFMCFVSFQQVTVHENSLLAPCALLKGECNIGDGDLYESWRKVAIEYRRLWKNGRRFDVCRSCACHFAENFRSSILCYPLANAKFLPWLLVYYLGRLYHREGRAV